MDSSGPELLLGMAMRYGSIHVTSQQTVPSARGAAMQTCQPRNVRHKDPETISEEKKSHVQQNLDNETMILST